jgi:hypothetical protein
LIALGTDIDCLIGAARATARKPVPAPARRAAHFLRELLAGVLMEPGEAPLESDSKAGMEAWVAERAKTDPGILQRWEDLQVQLAAREKEKDEQHRLEFIRDQKDHDRFVALGQSFTKMGKGANLIPDEGAIKAFAACLTLPDLATRGLYDVAKAYRRRLVVEDQEKESSISPAQLVNELGAVHGAAIELSNALKRLSPDGWRELEIGGTIACKMGRSDILEAGRNSEVWECEAWTRKLQGLQTYTKWLCDEVDRGIPKEHHNLAQLKETADDRLHRELLEVLRHYRISNRWLEHVARAVRAWALGLDSLVNLPPNWGKEARTRARSHWADYDRMIGGMIEAIIRCQRKGWIAWLQGVSFRRGRMGRIQR